MIKQVNIIGIGQMGKTIALRCIKHGYEVNLIDKDKRALKWLEEKATCEIHIHDNIEDISVADSALIIECVPEKIAIKEQLFKSLNKYSTAIIGSNTSSFLIRDLAEFVKNKNNFIGLHFMNPAHLIDLVEIIKSPLTSDSVFDLCNNFIQSIGCSAIESTDTPGFIVNRILIPMLNDAASLIEYIPKESIDACMEKGAKHPLGPLHIADLIGLDTCDAILKNLGITPAKAMQDLINKGMLGKKTGHGFF